MMPHPSGLLKGVALALALVPAALAVADTPQPVIEFRAADRHDLSLTLYQQGGGLVVESYRFDHPDGPLQLRLLDMPEGLQPRSVQARFAPPVLELREQRLLRDLLTPQRVLEAAVGGPVTLIEALADGTTRKVEGTLVTARNGIVLRTADGVITNPRGQMVFPSLPEDLPVRPAAAWEVEALEAGASTLEVTYLTAGPTWSADYVATLNPQQDHVQLTAWVTVDNQTAVPYADARLALVAGEVRRVTAPPRLMAGRMQAEAMDAPMVAEAGFSEAPGGDYHVYRLGRRIQLPARSVRQLVLHEAGQVPVRRRFVVRSGGLMGGGRSGPDRPLRLPVESRLELDNSADAGLGVPLPAGVARVYLEGEDGERLFLGEDRWPALARDEEVSLATGASFDLVAERTQTGYLRKPGDQRGYEASFQYDLRNRGIEDRTIDIRDSFPGSWKLLDSSHASSRPDAATLAFRIDVPAGGEVRVTYRVSGR